jgi:TIR domain-containing protein
MDAATASTGPAVKIAVSYSHRDERLRQALETHLSLLQRQGFIKVWHDRLIDAGTEWREQIDEHFESADLILLLVGPDFLASDYCYDVELKRALERHEARTVEVVPIILRPVDWYDAPFSKLQALPRDGKHHSISTKVMSARAVERDWQNR